MNELEKVLKQLVSDHDIRDVLQTLAITCDKQASQLVDMQLKDEAKILTLAAFHLSIFTID